MQGVQTVMDGCQLDPGAQIMGVIRRAFQLVLIVAFWLIPAIPAVRPVSANDIGSYAFQRIWNRTDQPVETHTVNRTWMWGPQPFTDVLLEPYVEGNVAGQQGVRRVQYFDKSRMEITDSTADPSSDWYVTNGLLAKEMITGRMQVGDNSYVDYGPAEINVAGDENDANAPTYATFAKLMDFQALPDGWTITQTVDRNGNVGSDPTVAAFNYYPRWGTTSWSPSTTSRRSFGISSTHPDRLSTATKPRTQGFSAIRSLPLVCRSPNHTGRRSISPALRPRCWFRHLNDAC